jgi:hypothetical protein
MVILQLQWYTFLYNFIQGDNNEYCNITIHSLNCSDVVGSQPVPSGDCVGGMMCGGKTSRLSQVCLLRAADCGWQLRPG